MKKVVQQVLPIVLMRKTDRAERAHEVVPMNKFLWWIRWFILAAIVAAICMGYVLWKVVGYSNTNRQLINDFKNQQATSHQERLQEDANLQGQISEAICTFVDPVPPGNAGVDKLRMTYACGPYVAPNVIVKPGSVVTTPTPSPSVRVGPTTQAPSPRSTTTITLTPTAPVTTAKPSQPAIINVPTLICIAGVCI